MRLALVVERFEPHGGGVEEAVWQTAHALARAGDEVHVFARKGQASPEIELHAVAAPRFWQPARVWTFTRRVARALDAQPRFDVIHSFCRGIRQDLFHAGGGSHADYMLRTYGPARAALRRVSPRHAQQLALERRIFEDASQHIQCVSQMVSDEIARRFAVPQERLTVVHYGVDSERYTPEREAATRARLRSEFVSRDPSAAVVWLLAGSGWLRKGVDTALRALAAVRDTPTQLWVAGRDKPAAWQRMATQLGVADRVRFLGARSDMPALYDAADGLILPTRYDAFGLVCLEAAASGLPVITSAAAGAAELMRGAGRIVDDPEDASGFAAALRELTSAELRARCGARGVEIAAAHSWDAQSQKLRALYREIAQ